MKRNGGRLPGDPDLIAALGPLALASRLKRLLDALLRDGARIYQAFGPDFHPRWFIVFYALSSGDRVSITALASLSGLSHAAINQIAGELLAAGLVAQGRDPRDDRLRMLKLTRKGRNLVPRLEPIWRDIRAAALDLFRDAGHDLIAVLAATEEAFEDKSVFDRIAARRGLDVAPQVEITDYRPAYKKHFAALNRDWLERCFTVEAEDERLLSDPKGRIINRGGSILFARRNNAVVGTCALIRHDADLYELAKMAVAPRHQKQGIGRKLGVAIIRRARTLGGKTLILHTSPKLKAAVLLYGQLGFKPTKRHAALAAQYARCTITMQMPLNGRKSRKKRG